MRVLILLFNVFMVAKVWGAEDPTATAAGTMEEDCVSPPEFLRPKILEELKELVEGIYEEKEKAHEEREHDVGPLEEDLLCYGGDDSMLVKGFAYCAGLDGPNMEMTAPMAGRSDDWPIGNMPEGIVPPELEKVKETLLFTTCLFSDVLGWTDHELWSINHKVVEDHLKYLKEQHLPYLDLGEIIEECCDEAHLHDMADRDDHIDEDLIDHVSQTVEQLYCVLSQVDQACYEHVVDTAKQCLAPVMLG